MALEFALRPRISLERPSPRRPLRRWRLPRIVLPIAAYWLAMAGVTHALLRSTAENPAEGSAPTSSLISPITAQNPATAQNAATDPSPEPDFEPAPTPPPLPEPEPDVAPAPTAPPLPEPEPDVARAVEPNVRARAPAVQRALVTPPAQPPPVVRSEPAAPERPDPFELVEERAPRQSEVAKAPASDAPARDETPARSLPSCESAAASANQTIDLRAARGAPDLTRDTFASVLENGAYLRHCSIPARTALEICAAVLDGKVVGVSVTAEPHNAAIGSCVRRAVSTLRFPRSARLDVTRTRFERTR